MILPEPIIPQGNLHLPFNLAKCICVYQLIHSFRYCLMPLTPAFFEFQLNFAERLSERFGLTLDDVITNYTNIGRHLRLSDAGNTTAYFSGLNSTSDSATWTYQFYASLPVEPADDHKTFGYWRYEIREGIVLRQHLVDTNTTGGKSILASEFQEQRIAEIAELQRYVRANEPAALYVKGFSWLYHIESYRRLFPPKYIQTMAGAEYADYTYMSLWGQFYRRDWSIRQDAANYLLSNLNELKSISSLIDCFPYRPLVGICEIEIFRSFYGID